MATYIPQITDYLPQIQPFQPDYNFLSNILQTKQSRYDAAHKQISGVYGTLLNSPMLRDENIQKRDRFFQMIDQDIRKITGVDLSLQQNVDTAMNIFRPFYEDKDMVKDMTWTKNWMKQLERGENFRTCVDPDKCGGQYWEGGIQALQWKAQEFKTATKEQALNFDNPYFTPFINVTDKAIKAAKDAGFSVSFDEVKGGYIVTTKNGDRMIAPLASFFTSKFGSDPNVTAYFKTQAYLQRKNWVAQNAPAYGGEDKATMAYIQNMTSNTRQQIGNKKLEADQDHDSTQVIKTSLDNYIKKNGVLLDDSEFTEIYSDAVTGAEVSSQNKAFYDNADNVSGNMMENAQNYMYMADKFDELVGLNLLSNELISAASAYANLTMEQKLTADPYALASHNASLSLKNSLILKDADFEIWKKKKEYEGQLELQKQEQIYGPDKMQINPNLLGITTTEVKNVAQQENIKKLNSLYKGAQGDKLTFVKSMIDAVQTDYSTTGENYNLAVDNIERVFKAAGIKNGRKHAVNILKGSEDRVSSLALLESLGAGALDNAYGTATSLSDPSGKGAWKTINSSWNKAFWDKTLEERVAITNKDSMYKIHAKINQDQSTTLGKEIAGEYRATGNTKIADFTEFLLSQTHNGIIPSDPAWREKVAIKFLEVSGEEVPTSYSSGTPGSNVVAPSYVSKVAPKYLLDSIDQISDKLDQKYLEKGESFNHLDVFGMGSTDKTTMGLSGWADPNLPQRNTTRNFAELLKNYETAGAGVKVAFGTGEILPVDTDPKASAILDQLKLEFFSNAGKKTGIRPSVNYDFQRIAGGNPNYFAFSVKPNAEWVKKYKGSEKSPGLTAEMFGEGDQVKPITVFIPKTDANNNLYKATEFDDFDVIMEHTGIISMNQYKTAGMIDLSKVGSQYYAKGYLNMPDETGKIIQLPVNETYNIDISPSVIYYDWTKKLSELQTLINQHKNTLAKDSGVKDPEKVFQYTVQ